MTKSKDPSKRVRELVYRRDNGVCVAEDHSPCGGIMTVQHRVGRGMGGSGMPGINAPSNLIAMCYSHNLLIESSADFRDFALRNGWSIPRNWTPSLEPADIPVRYHDGPHLIDADGNRSPVSEVIAAELWGVYGAGWRVA